MIPYRHSERFADARDRWFDARRAAQSKAKGLRVSVDIQRQMQKWEANASRYLRGGRPGLLKSDWMTADPREINREILNIIAEVQPEVAEAVDKVMADRAFAIWRDWPVSSGLSKSMIRQRYTVRSGNLVASIASDAPYTTFIKGNPARALLDAKMTVQGGIETMIISALRNANAGTGSR